MFSVGHLKTRSLLKDGLREEPKPLCVWNILDTGFTGRCCFPAVPSHTRNSSLSDFATGTVPKKLAGAGGVSNTFASFCRFY